MSARKISLSRSYVHAVAEAVCRRKGVDLAAVVGPNGTREESRVRATIWRIILRATGCSANELARVWGCDVGSVLRMKSHRFRRASTQPVTLSGPELQARNTLLFHYGPERTAAILAGRDEATNADLAAWRRLGTGARA